MSDLQYRIWQEMSRAIDRFEKGNLTMNELAKTLEPPMTAAPITDKAFLERWYRYWEPIEIKNAVDLAEGKLTQPQAVSNLISEMREFMDAEADRVRKM